MLCATPFESNAEIPAASKGEVTDRGRARRWLMDAGSDNVIQMVWKEKPHAMPAGLMAANIAVGS